MTLGADTESARREVMSSDVMMALLALFAVADGVFTIEGAFTPQHIHKSLGRLYQEWKRCRKVLDPAFNPKDYPKTQRPSEAPVTPADR